MYDGNGDVSVSGGEFTVKNNASLHNLTNRGNSIIEGTLIATGEVRNYNNLTINGNASASNLLNEGDMDVKGSLYVAQTLTNTGDLDVFGIVKANEINNSGNMNVQNSADIEIEGRSEEHTSELQSRI